MAALGITQSLSAVATRASEAATLWGGRFVSQFQNRFLAGVALAISTYIGFIIGFEISKAMGSVLHNKLEPKLPSCIRYSNCYYVATLCVVGIGGVLPIVALNIKVAKWLKLPLSLPLSIFISAVVFAKLVYSSKIF